MAVFNNLSNGRNSVGVLKRWSEVVFSILLRRDGGSHESCKFSILPGGEEDVCGVGGGANLRWGTATSVWEYGVKGFWWVGDGNVP